MAEGIYRTDADYPIADDISYRQNAGVARLAVFEFGATFCKPFEFLQPSEPLLME